MTFQDLGDGFYRVGGTNRSALTGRFTARAPIADTVPGRPLLIVAASMADGKEAAAAIGVEDFAIITPRSDAQVGHVIRGVVLTPRLGTLLEANDRAASKILSCARIDARKSGVPFG